MADPLLAKPDDVAAAYLDRRQQAKDGEAMDFLMAGTAQANEAKASPIEPITKAAIKEIPPTIAGKVVAGAASAAPDFNWTFENVWNASKRGSVDFLKGSTVDLPRAIVGGARDTAQELLNASHSLDVWMNENVADLGNMSDGGKWKPGMEGTGFTLPNLDEPSSVTGKMYRDVTQFIAGFIPVIRGVRMIGVGTGAGKVAGGVARAIGKNADKVATAAKVTKGAVETSLASGITDAVAFDPYEKRIADGLASLLENHPQLQKPVQDYMATDPTDPEATARLKRGLEGLSLGLASEGLIGSLRWLRGKIKERATRKADGGGGGAGGPGDTTAKLTPATPATDNTAATQAADMKAATDPLPALGDSAKPLVRLLDKQEAADFQAANLADAIDGSQRININLSRLNTEADVKEAIAVTGKLLAKDMSEAQRGKISQAETEKLASDLGMTPEDLLSRRSGQAFNAEEALASRQILASSGEQLVGLAKKSATVDASTADVMAFRRALSLHSAIQQQVSGMTAEAGRALQAFRIIAKGQAERGRQIAELMDANGGDMFNRDMARRLADIATENPAALNKSAREMNNVSGWDQMYEVWVNGLLSGPKTHAVNVLSNALVALWQVPERYLASKFGQFLGTEGGVQAGEATAQAFGMIQGFKDGLALSVKAIRTGESSDLIGKMETSYRSFTAENFATTKAGRVTNFMTAGSLDQGGIAARAVDLMGAGARVPSRFLTAEDELFKAVGYRMELRAQAFRTAKLEGLKGKAMAKRIEDIVANPPENLHLSAVDAARYQTFTKPLGEAGQAAQKWIRKVPGLRLIAPFVRTPTNILKYVGERTPLAVMSKSIRADVAAGGARRDLALARISLGSMIMATAADMTASGLITGGGPSNRKMKAIKRDTGWQQYSVKIGDKYYSYSRLDPLGMLFGLAADSAEIMGQMYDIGDNGAGLDNLAMAAVMSIAKNTTSKTWMTGPTELINAISDPDRNATRFLSRFAGTFIPTGAAQVTQAIDPTLRDTHGLDLWQSMLNKTQSRIPGYSKDLPPRTNLWGEPIVLGGGLGPDIVSPIYTSTKKASPVNDELLRLGLPLSMPGRHIGGVKLTATEYHRFVELAGNGIKDPASGKGLKDTLSAIVTGKHPLSSAYKRATDGPDGGKAIIIRRFVSGFRTQAKATLVGEFPELSRLINDARKEKTRNLTGGAPDIKAAKEGIIQ